MNQYQVLSHIVNTTIGITLVAAYLRSRHWAAVKLKKFIAIIGAIQLIGIVVYAIILWREYASDPLKNYFLPPHSLFYLRHLQTDITTLAISWLAALVLFWGLCRIFIVRGQGRFIDNHDIALLVIGAVAVGWPAVFIFLVGIFILVALAMIVLVIIKKKTTQDRLIITPYIIPAAIAVLAFKGWLLTFTYLWKIGF